MVEGVLGGPCHWTLFGTLRTNESILLSDYSKLLGFLGSVDGKDCLLTEGNSLKHVRCLTHGPWVFSIDRRKDITSLKASPLCQTVRRNEFGDNAPVCVSHCEEKQRSESATDFKA